MNYSFIIRKATVEDAGSISSVLQESFSKYLKVAGLNGTMDALKETVEDIKVDIERKVVFIALIDEMPVGTARVEFLKDNTAYLTRFGVRPDFHNIGIGKAMMNVIDKLLIAEGIKKVRLHTASNYKGLVRFYYGRGFFVESVSYERGYPRACMIKQISLES